MKKSISLLVALVLMMTMFATNAFAATDPAFTMSAEMSVKSEGTFVTVNVGFPDELDNIAGFGLYVNYDATAFAVSEVLATTETTDGSVVVARPEEDGSKHYVKYERMKMGGTFSVGEGESFSIVFKVLDTAVVSNTYQFTMSDFSATKMDLSSLPVVGADPAEVVIPRIIAAADFTVVPVEVQYNGQPHPASFTLNNGTTAGDFTVSYSTTDGKLDASGKPFGAGTYAVKFTGTAGGVVTVANAVKITKAPLTVTADAATKVYGQADPALTYTTTGLVDGDTLTGALTRAAGENVGTYDITQGTLSSKNYDITFTKGTMTITKKTLTIKPVNVEVKAGEAYVVYEVDGLVGTDKLSTEPTVKYTDSKGNVSTDAPTKAGEYTFEIVTGTAVDNSGNYAIGYAASLTGTLKITGSRPPQSGKPGSVSNFVDVDARAYYYDAVEWAVANGITEGKTFFKFAPNEACTRAQMVTFLWRAAGCPTPSGSYSKFVDVNMNKYYADAVLWAVEEGITAGKTATTFAPNEACTRAQMATFLYRFAGGSAIGSTSGFVDVDSSKYYAPAVAWAVKNGITNGTTANTFSPNNVCTRAQMVTFLYRYFEA